MTPTASPGDDGRPSTLQRYGPLGAIVVVIVAWFAILFTGSYPKGIFDFVQGVIRWNNRVIGYAVTLVTDRYPPFSLAA